MIRPHKLRDANFGHLAQKSGITPRGKFVNFVKESEKYRLCLSQILFPAFTNCLECSLKMPLVVARSELETKGLRMQHVLATMRWYVTLAGRTTLHVECHSLQLHFPLVIIRLYCEDMYLDTYLDPASQEQRVRQRNACNNIFWKSKTKR